jgi:hypothetical protein
VNPLCRYPPRMNRSSNGRTRLWGIHAAVLTTAHDRGKSSLRLWLPYRVSPVHHRDPNRDP